MHVLQPSCLEDLDKHLDLQQGGGRSDLSLLTAGRLERGLPVRHPIRPNTLQAWTPNASPLPPPPSQSARPSRPAACTRGTHCGCRRPQTWPGHRTRRARGGRTARAQYRAAPPSTQCSSRCPPLPQLAAQSQPAAQALPPVPLLARALGAQAGQPEPAGALLGLALVL